MVVVAVMMIINLQTGDKPRLYYCAACALSCVVMVRFGVCRLFGTTGYCAACNKMIPAFEDGDEGERKRVSPGVLRLPTVQSQVGVSLHSAPHTFTPTTTTTPFSVYWFAFREDTPLLEGEMPIAEFPSSCVGGVVTFLRAGALGDSLSREMPYAGGEITCPAYRRDSLSREMPYFGGEITFPAYRRDSPSREMSCPGGRDYTFPAGEIPFLAGAIPGLGESSHFLT